jgi:pimeloyl-ACP methyl ester carboxylesterase
MSTVALRTSDSNFSTPIQNVPVKDHRPPFALRPIRLARLALFGLFCTAGILLLASMGLSYTYVRALTQSGCPEDQQQPSDYGLAEFRSVEFTTADAVALSGWLIPSQNGATIVLLGGRGTRSAMLPEGAMLARHGYGLLLFDWRGCGADRDNLHTLGYQETLDVMAATDFLLSENDGEQVGVLGFSLGGAAAIRAAALHPGIAAVVAMGNYHDLEAEIRGAGDEHPVLSAIFENQIAWLFQQETGVSFAEEPEPVELVAQISPRPVLLIFGELEESLPPASGHLLFQAAGEPRELWIIPRVGHGGYFQAEPEEFERRVTSLFDSALLH